MTRRRQTLRCWCGEASLGPSSVTTRRRRRDADWTSVLAAGEEGEDVAPRVAEGVDALEFVLEERPDDDRVTAADPVDGEMEPGVALPSVRP